MSAVSESMRALGLDPQADPRRRREAELAGELAKLVGVVADDLVERVLDELATLPADQGARLDQQPRGVFVPRDALAICPQDVRVRRTDDAGVAHVAQHPPPDDLGRVVHVGRHLRQVGRRDRLVEVQPARARLAAQPLHLRRRGRRAPPTHRPAPPSGRCRPASAR